ncbi:MAG: hypothetical protein DMF72_15240 [Acidobacteria bacterium]|nr:MAG: hypothetical protein DMF72_15240 [Acidobacteriota bacterium]
MGLKKTFSSVNPAINGRANGKAKRLIRISIVILILAASALAFLFIHSYRSYAKIVDARMAHGYLVSRAGIYAAPRTLRAGQKYSRDALAAILRRAGYVENEDVSEVWNGGFTVRNDSIEIRPNNNGSYPSLVRIKFEPQDRIAEITGDDIVLDAFRLAPESLTNNLSKSSARTQLSFKDIPPMLVHAITSIEDRRFFDHHGVDIVGVARALLRNVGDERIGQGGSTITQQLIKNTYLTPERTLRRKYAEAMLALTLERRLSKEDIFALYCNEVYLGQRDAIAVRGVDQAAHVYFGKELKALTLTEAATIAGMIQSPTRYSPAQQNAAARERRNTVLGTMARDGFITLDEAAATAKEPLSVANFDPARESVAPYFIDYVNRVNSPTVSESLEGAPIITTLDLDLERLALDAIKHQLDRLDRVYQPRGLTPQVALVALDPKTGKVLAMVGGRDYAQSQLNRATDAQRQPGSTFKPFVYAAALESGMSPLQLFKDAPQEFSYAAGRKYRPANYGGGFTMRDLPMRDGLIKSLNVVTVDVAMQTGLARVANTALKFGLPRPTPYPALALGTTEVTPLQLTAAYAVFANGGKKIEPQVIVSEAMSPDDQVIAPTTAFIITDMLQGVIDHGTARAARGSIANTAVAGKTGTSRDGWFVGYTPNLVCAVWIGFDDNQQLGLTGAEAALPVWTEFMKGAIDFRPELGGTSFDQPEGITIAEVDPDTDELATGKCPMHERVALLTEQAPTSECFRHNVYFDSSDLNSHRPVTQGLIRTVTERNLS